MSVIGIIIFIFTLFALSRVILRSKDKSISFGESLFWIVIWITIAFITAFPQVTDRVSQILGVGRGVDVAFFVAIIILFYVVFRLYVKIDSLDKNLTELTINISKRLHKKNHSGKNFK